MVVALSKRSQIEGSNSVVLTTALQTDGLAAVDVAVSDKGRGVPGPYLTEVYGINPRNAQLKNFQHYFAISLQLQLSILFILLPY